MSVHTDFHQFLSNRKNGAEIQEACKAYKSASFELNGRLKGGLPLAEQADLFEALKRAICATNRQEMLLYRKTSDTEFVGPLLKAIRREPIVYPAFLSTSATFEHIRNFAISGGNPLVLKITCPPGTFMAPLEGEFSKGEDEYLLGVGTTFCSPEISTTTLDGVKVVQLLLTVESSPEYATSREDRPFSI